MVWAFWLFSSILYLPAIVTTPTWISIRFFAPTSHHGNVFRYCCSVKPEHFHRYMEISKSDDKTRFKRLTVATTSFPAILKEYLFQFDLGMIPNDFRPILDYWLFLPTTVAAKIPLDIKAFKFCSFTQFYSASLDTLADIYIVFSVGFTKGDLFSCFLIGANSLNHQYQRTCCLSP